MIWGSDLALSAPKALSGPVQLLPGLMYPSYRLVIIAVQGGVKSGFNAGLVLRRRLTITGSTLRPRSVAFKGAIARHLHENVWPLMEARRIKPVIYATFHAASTDGAENDQRLMESNQHIGKFVLTWGQ
jgi:NADPH2:quinone reductase